MSHHVHITTDGQTDRISNRLISTNVHYVHLGGDNRPNADDNGVRPIFRSICHSKS